MDLGKTSLLFMQIEVEILTERMVKREGEISGFEHPVNPVGLGEKMFHFTVIL